ncbi:MAG TPA: hypothetical protein VNB64_02820 [Solirubrobacteraceae bacterium]|nr:hypothetical protein [Solirubrobacteraceae bacterium]
MAKFHGPSHPRSPGSSTASMAARTAAMFPAPPHCASSRPPGRRAPCRRPNRASWSAIQWKVALENTASTGSGRSSSSRSDTSTVARGSSPRAARARSAIAGDPSTA